MFRCRRRDEFRRGLSDREESQTLRGLRGSEVQVSVQVDQLRRALSWSRVRLSGSHVVVLVDLLLIIKQTKQHLRIL